MDYTFNEDKWYALYHITTGELILKDKLDTGFVLSTIHTVVWITEAEYNQYTDKNN